MSASPIENERNGSLRMALGYLAVTVLCAVFGAVYELFSHGVYAAGMVYAFGFPLLGGLMPSLLYAKQGKPLPSETGLLLWHFGISALTVGSLFSGALEIYGTASPLTTVYWLMGGLCLFMGGADMLILRKKAETEAGL